LLLVQLWERLCMWVLLMRRRQWLWLWLLLLFQQWT
jgi:hypothetical protein